MRFLYPLILLFWLCSALPTGEPLGAGGGAYTVRVVEDAFYVFTPYFKESEYAVTVIELPTDRRLDKQLIIRQAWNAQEKRPWFSTPRLHLSEIIRAVISEKTDVQLNSLKWVIARDALNKETIAVLKDFISDYNKRLANKHAPRQEPVTVSVEPSDSFWPAFRQTPFFKTVNYIFRDENKIVDKLEIVITEVKTDDELRHQADIWFRLAPRTP
ncbi:hypothetical protein LZ30DRAFT_133079 [Colletotrichum cereale]|nr:hypothetical protein LZ30DRAFT_133079 [Colletotrichum cereale]